MSRNENSHFYCVCATFQLIQLSSYSLLGLGMRTTTNITALHVLEYASFNYVEKGLFAEKTAKGRTDFSLYYMYLTCLMRMLSRAFSCSVSDWVSVGAGGIAKIIAVQIST